MAHVSGISCRRVKMKININFTLEQPMKTKKGSGGTSVLFSFNNIQSEWEAV